MFLHGCLSVYSLSRYIQNMTIWNVFDFCVLTIYIFSLWRFFWKEEWKKEGKCLSILSLRLVNLFLLWYFISRIFMMFFHMKIWTWTTILQYNKRNIYIICVLFGHVTFFEWTIWFFLIKNLNIFCMFCKYSIICILFLSYFVFFSLKLKYGRSCRSLDNFFNNPTKIAEQYMKSSWKN